LCYNLANIVVSACQKIVKSKLGEAASFVNREKRDA